MKTMRKITAFLAAVLVMLSCGISARAAYQYKVTVLAGLHGTVNGTDKVETTVNAGAQWSPNDYTVAVTDERYYFKGFHISGIEDLSTGGAQTINEDVIFVASYGIKGATVGYTVRFVDASGNQLADPVTYYGNVGDKPVVAFQYIDGYVPNAYNITGTLKENAADNVFTFVYTQGTGGGTSGEGGTTTTDEGVTYITVPGENAGNAGNAGNAANAGQAANPGGEQIEDNQTPQTGPQQIIDIDENEAPLANYTPTPTPGSTTTGTAGLSAFWKAVIGICAVGMLALLIILILLLKRRKEEKEQQ